MSKWGMHEELLRALSVIFGLTGSSLPKDLMELLRMMYPQYESWSSAARAREYTKLRSLLSGKKVRKWLGAIFGKFPESQLAQCSPEERKLAQAILEKHPHSCNALYQRVSDLLEGQRHRVHRGGR